jgi:hypothetical protein
MRSPFNIRAGILTFDAHVKNGHFRRSRHSHFKGIQQSVSIAERMSLIGPPARLIGARRKQGYSKPLDTVIHGLDKIYNSC